MMRPKVPAKVTSDIDRIKATTWNALVDCVNYGMSHPYADGKTTSTTEDGAVVVRLPPKKVEPKDYCWSSGANAYSVTLSRGASVIVSNGVFKYAGLNDDEWGVVESDVLPGCAGRALFFGRMPKVMVGGQLDAECVAPDGSGGLRSVVDSITKASLRAGALYLDNNGRRSIPTAYAGTANSLVYTNTSWGGGSIRFEYNMGDSDVTVICTGTRLVVSNVMFNTINPLWWGSSSVSMFVASTPGQSVVKVPRSAVGALYLVISSAAAWNWRGALQYSSGREFAYNGISSSTCVVPLGVFSGLACSSGEHYLHYSQYFFSFSPVVAGVPQVIRFAVSGGGAEDDGKSSGIGTEGGDPSSSDSAVSGISIAGATTVYVGSAVEVSAVVDPSDANVGWWGSNGAGSASLSASGSTATVYGLGLDVNVTSWGDYICFASCTADPADPAVVASHPMMVLSSGGMSYPDEASVSSAATPNPTATRKTPLTIHIHSGAYAIHAAQGVTGVVDADTGNAADSYTSNYYYQCERCDLGYQLIHPNSSATYYALCRCGVVEIHCLCDMHYGQAKRADGYVDISDWYEEHYPL